MKPWLLFLFLLSTALARSVEHREIQELNDRDAQLKNSLCKIHALYRDDPTFLSALDSSQKAWESYCDATLAARFPAINKTEAYGSAFPIAYASVKKSLVETRIKELSLWVEGTEEGDVSKGSVKLKKELDEMQLSKSRETTHPNPRSSNSSSPHPK